MVIFTAAPVSDIEGVPHLMIPFEHYYKHSDLALSADVMANLAIAMADKMVGRITPHTSEAW